MGHTRKNFITKNDGFTCAACQTIVPPARGTCRNHCSTCLTSKHVDATIPGDRASTCGGLMPAIHITGTDPDHLTLVHRCEQCGYEQNNRTAPDDNKDRLFNLFRP